MVFPTTWILLCFMTPLDLIAPELPFPREIKSDEAPLPPGAIFRFGSSHYRHIGRIDFSLLSPDEKILVTCGNRTTIVWDIETGKRLHVFANYAHPSPNYSNESPNTAGQASFSSDGRYLAQTSMFDVAVRVWDLKTGKEVRTIGKRPKQKIGNTYEELDGSLDINFVCFLPDKLELLMGDYRSVYWYDFAKDKITKTLTTGMYCLDATPDGKQLLITKLDENIRKYRLFDISTKRVIEELAEYKSDPNGSFSANGKWMVYLDQDHRLCFRQRTKEKENPESISLPVKEGSPLFVTSLIRISNDDKYLAFGNQNNIILMDRESKKQLRTFTGHHDLVKNIHFRNQSKELISTSLDGTIRRWDLETGKPIPISPGYSRRIFSAISRDGKRVVVGDESGKVDLWDAITGKHIRSFDKVDNNLQELAIAPDARCFATVHFFHNSPQVCIWDAVTGKNLSTFRFDKTPYDSGRLIWEPDGKHLLALIEGRAIVRWDSQKWAPIWKNDPNDNYEDISLSWDGNQLWASHLQNSIVQLDLETGRARQIVPLTKEGDKARALAISPRYLVSTGFDGKLRFWDFLTRTEQITLQAHHEIIQSMHFTPDHRWFISTGQDRKLRIFETLTQKELRCDANWFGIPEVRGITPDGKHLLIDHGLEAFLWQFKPQKIKPFTSFKELWTNLQSEDGPTIHDAIWTLAEHLPQVVQELQAQIQLQPQLNEKNLKTLLKQFESDRFAEREKAEKEFGSFGSPALPFLQKFLESKPNADSQERMKKLIDRIRREIRPQDILNDRILQAIELNGSAEAKVLLKTWAEGGPFMDAAKESLSRLNKNQK